MQKIFFQLLIVPMLGIALGAQASTITAGVYALTGVMVNGYSLTGNMTIDSNGLVTAANLTYNNAVVNTPTFTTIASTGSYGASPVLDYIFLNGAAGQVGLGYLEPPTSAGTISLCTMNAMCSGNLASYLQINSYTGFNGSGTAYLSSGVLNAYSASGASTLATGVTPEPSSLALLGTGAFAVAILGLRMAARQKTYPASEVNEV